MFRRYLCTFSRQINMESIFKGNLLVKFNHGVYVHKNVEMLMDFGPFVKGEIVEWVYFDTNKLENNLHLESGEKMYTRTLRTPDLGF